MMPILEQFNRPAKTFVPTTIHDYVALQIALKLDDITGMEEHLEAVEHGIESAIKYAVHDPKFQPHRRSPSESLDH